ncbi:MAG: hypothetical protein EAZ91_06910 [Cytophagales bacterium]|nr:MAG: hypothetical protein EAZ91_06910 [Cytophagales bacterium]
MTAHFYTRFSLRAISISLVMALLTLLLIDASCRRKGEIVEPAVLADTLAPKITKMHIPGIPPENIRIDQVKRLLIVTVPKDYPTSYRDGVKLTMTPGAKQLREFPLQVDLCRGTFSDSRPMTPITTEDFMYDPKELIITDGKRQKAYRLKIKPEGEMAFMQPGKRYTVGTDETGDILENIAVFNYIDSLGDNRGTVIFRNIATGEEFKGEIGGCQSFGHIYLGRPYHLLPGEYSLKIRKSTGRQTVNELFVTVVPGKFVYYGAFGKLSGDRQLRISGSSLFNGKQAVLDVWHNRTGVRFQITDLSFDRRGNVTSVTIPPNVASGIYYSTLTYDNRKSGIAPVTILNDDNQPTTGYISTDFANIRLYPKNSSPVVLHKGQLYYNWPSPTEAIKAGRNLEVHIQSIKSPSLAYSIPIKLPKYWADSPPWAASDYPTFTIPDSVLPGTYLYRVQYIDKEGIKQIGDWIEVDVEIQ